MGGLAVRDGTGPQRRSLVDLLVVDRGGARLGIPVRVLSPRRGGGRDGRRAVGERRVGFADDGDLDDVAPSQEQPDETQLALFSVTSAVAVLYSVTWMVVPPCPVGKGGCCGVGSALLGGAVTHAIIASDTASAARK